MLMRDACPCRSLCLSGTLRIFSDERIEASSATKQYGVNEENWIEQISNVYCFDSATGHQHH